ncbi:MAG: hypothetical protein AAB545_01355 [Patescibacteria group bacterium]
MFQNFLMKKLLESKLKDIPKEQQEMIFAMLEKNPELFMKIAEEMKSKSASGRSEMDVAQEVLKKYEGELKALMVE